MGIIGIFDHYVANEEVLGQRAAVQGAATTNVRGGYDQIIMHTKGMQQTKWIRTTVVWRPTIWSDRRQPKWVLAKKTIQQKF